MGACVECLAPSDCPGQDTECQVRTCVANTCGFSFTPAGTPVSMQAAGDCQVAQCDGAGGVTTAADNADLPVDGSQCTDDLCTAGVPSNPPLGAGAACNEGGGQFCDGNGACVECLTAATCPGQDTECQMRTCLSNTCGLSFAPPGTPLAMQTDGDCQEGQCNGAGGMVNVDDDLDVPVDGNECTYDVCTAGVPSNPPAQLGDFCNVNMICDGAGMCVECIDGSDCASGVCQNGLCVQPTCSDNIQNGDETDVDCGGVDCPPCADGQLCQFPSDCQSGVCPVGICEAPTCSDGVQNQDETGIDCGGVVCLPCQPVVAGVDYAVIAHGGRLVITGSNLLFTTSVTVGGATQGFVVNTDTQISVLTLADTTPLGAQDVVVTTLSGSAAPLSVTVIRLQINEVDPNTPGTDMAEFVEISTGGVPNVSLAGYTLVFWNGSNDLSYSAIGLNATTDASGMLLAGNVGVVPAPALTWADNFLQNGADAIGIHQDPASAFPNGSSITAIRLIDAVVYASGGLPDDGLLDGLISSDPGSPARVQVDENANGVSATESMQRCADGRRDGSKYALAAPTPGAVNTVAPCP
jgi:hypothetical protein